MKLTPTWALQLTCTRQRREPGIRRRPARRGLACKSDDTDAEVFAMGMYDTVLVLDDIADLRCPEGHHLQSFQTKDLDEPSLSTYLVSSGRLYRAAPRQAKASAERAPGWRVAGTEAIFEQRHDLQALPGPRRLNVYGQCSACEPVLVRTGYPGAFGDLVNEHPLFVDFTLTFRIGEPLQVERTSGTRAGLEAELANRGVYVLKQDDPLAIAHREIERARKEAKPRSAWGRR